ncbi:MAG: DUF2452 domain-containing protein [Flammeovirgaceae bacterium]
MADKKNKNEIDVNKIDLEKMREQSAENPGLLPYAHTAGGAIVKPEDMGKVMGKAIQAMHEQTDNQFQQLYEQMQVLVQQAQGLKERKEVSERIYLADIPFEPVIGHTYYLYMRDEDSDVLSMIAPHEWGRTKRYKRYLATVYLLADHTWEVKDLAPAEEAEENE